MLKKILYISIVLSLLAFALAISPSQAKAATSTWQYSSSGKGAEAYFTTCFEWPSPGTVCTDTGIYVGEFVFKEDGTKYPSSTMSFYQTQYKVDPRGNWIWISDTWGYGEASLSVDNKLTRATASGDLQLTTCTPGRRGEINCSETGMVTLSASWSGVGDLFRSKSNSHTLSKAYNYTSHYSGSYRDAIAQVSGLDTGVQYWASIYNTSSMEVIINHGGW
ncbi:MAG: hypothetical protein JSV42_01360 [Chloroflexota bacterium]|nr:MAG: hypothetical protein JSV42_01360 [Chloroflexota bacterium]